MLNEGWGLLLGHTRGHRLGHTWGVNHSHGHQGLESEPQPSALAKDLRSCPATDSSRLARPRKHPLGRLFHTLSLDRLMARVGPSERYDSLAFTLGRQENGASRAIEALVAIDPTVPLGSVSLGKP